MDIWIVPTTSGGEKPWAFVATPAEELAPAFSPDGKWLSYMSDESGRYEIYAVAFPGPGGKRQISTGGVTEGGGFIGKGLEVMYGGPGTTLFQVDARTGSTGLEIAPAKALYKMPLFSTITGTADGDRMLLAVPPEGQRVSRVGIIANWTNGLSR